MVLLERVLKAYVLNKIGITRSGTANWVPPLRSASLLDSAPTSSLTCVRFVRAGVAQG